MHALNYTVNHTVNLQHQDPTGVHHYTADLTKCTYATNPDGSTNTDYIMTPELVCTDPGCDVNNGQPQTAQSCIPLHGDGFAQQFHCYWRVAISANSKQITVPVSAQSVINDVVAAKIQPRINTAGAILNSVA